MYKRPNIYINTWCPSKQILCVEMYICTAAVLSRGLEGFVIVPSHAVADRLGIMLQKPSSTLNMEISHQSASDSHWQNSALETMI